MKKGLHPKKVKIYIRSNKGSVFIFFNHFQNHDFLINLKNIKSDKLK